MLFELASEDRLQILAFLEGQPARLTEVARKLSATDPEASRHLSRLSKAGLIAKNPDGAYALTPFGRLTCATVPPFRLLAERQEYFLSHDLSTLPPEFLRRIGELAEHRYLDHLDDVLGLVEDVTRGAKEYIWILTDRPVRLEHRHPNPATMSVRVIAPRAFEDAVTSLMRQNWPGAKLELAYLEPAPTTLLVNEHLACVFFHGLDGRTDMSRGLSGDSPAFHGWCRDLFETLGKRARKALL